MTAPGAPPASDDDPLGGPIPGLPPSLPAEPQKAGWGLYRLRIRRGAPPRDAVLRMEHFNVTAAEQRRREAIERSRGRLVIAAGLFAAMFAVVGFRVAWVTIVNP